MRFLAVLTLAAATAALPTGEVSSRKGAVHEGNMTFNLEFNSNSCGIPAAAMNVAISAETFDQHSPVNNNGLKNSNLNTLCGKQLQITNPATGASTSATIVDRKASGTASDIDVSPAVFNALGLSQDAGNAAITWAEPI